GWQSREPGEIPGGFEERIERIGLAPGLLAAGGAGDVFPGRVMFQRVAGPVERYVARQFHRQILRRYRHRAAGVAMDDRDRAAPIALPRNAPVAQAVIGARRTGL